MNGDAFAMAREMAAGVKALHAAYEAGTGARVPFSVVRFPLERLAADGATAEDMTALISWTVRKIADTRTKGDRAETRRFPVSLTTGKLLEPERFWNDLNLARAEEAARKKKPAQSPPARSAAPVHDRAGVEDLAAFKAQLRPSS
jgi:hypothetical protein